VYPHPVQAIRICFLKKEEIWGSLMLSLDIWRLFLELGNPVRMYKRNMEFLF
jgi:hypothetical protein